ncbi:uncharacterized [Tachysurus ichikawai]
MFSEILQCWVEFSKACITALCGARHPPAAHSMVARFPAFPALPRLLTVSQTTVPFQSSASTPLTSVPGFKHL